MTLPLIQDFINSDSIMAHYDFDNPIYQAEEEAEEDCEISEELDGLLRQEEKFIQLHQETREVINLGTNKVKKKVKIGAALEESVKQRLIKMLWEYVDIFAWSYEDMPGLHTDIVLHKLRLKEDCPLVK